MFPYAASLSMLNRLLQTTAPEERTAGENRTSLLDYQVIALSTKSSLWHSRN